MITSRKYTFSPFSGLRIVDMTRVLAGPICTQILGGWGAEVIKLESMQGDQTRAWSPKNCGSSTFFQAVNFNKRSIAVNLRTPEGRGILERLIKSADVVIHNYRAKTKIALGLSWETVHRLNEQAIYCEITAYGRQGPLKAAPGFDAVIQAYSGMLSTMGNDMKAYARASFSPVDMGTGQNAALSIIAALKERENTGRGVRITMSLVETALFYMSYMAQALWATGIVPQPLGTAHATMCPYQVVKTKDGELFIAAGTDRQWIDLCRAIGLECLLGNPKFDSVAARVANRGETIRLVEQALCIETTEVWCARLRENEVPCSPVKNLAEALAEETVSINGTVTEGIYNGRPRMRKIAFPATFNNASREPMRKPPQLGENSKEILLEIGYCEQDVTRYVEQNIVKE